MLFTPIQIGPIQVRNRIVSTGHDTVMVHDGLVTDQLVAYQRERAKGGVGLIVVQVAGVHESARYTPHVLMATTDDCLPGYQRLAGVAHDDGAAIFGQLFHPGREITDTADGHRPVALAPSAVPTERFRVMPRAMTLHEIDELIYGYASAARRLVTAGLDGVEFVASHGYLPAQFWSETLNLRDDIYGLANGDGLTFHRSALQAIRDAVGPSKAVGIRVSGDDQEVDGFAAVKAIEACRTLADEGLLDYVSVCVGSSATAFAASHIAAPMNEAPGYSARYAEPFKEALDIPVIVTGRINEVQTAEQILQAQQADMCGMTRALICDPQLPAKAQTRSYDTIRACIACNQACIGRFQKGLAISCIQHPGSGRELEQQSYGSPRLTRHVVVVGAGPAGLKCAVTAAARGHKVTLLESQARPGGQVLLAEQLPSRAEFGGAVTNLLQEIDRHDIDLLTGTTATDELLQELEPDAVIYATGSAPTAVEEGIEIADSPHLITAWQAIQEPDHVGSRVLIADTRGDWVALGTATMLSRLGRKVTLATTGYAPGEAIQNYVQQSMMRDALLAGVDVRPNTRLRGADVDTAFLQHTLTNEFMELSPIETIVRATIQIPRVVPDKSRPYEVHLIGDCLAPRTVEEAILEGWRIGMTL